MGLFSNDSTSTTQQFDQRQVNDASRGGLVGDRNQIRTQVSITDGSATVTPMVLELIRTSSRQTGQTADRTVNQGLTLASDAQTEALRLARTAIDSATGQKTAQAGLAIVGLVMVAVLFRRA